MSENKNFFRASAEDFKKVPGSPVAYWVSQGTINAFSAPKLIESFSSCGRFKTCNDELYLRLWWEVAGSIKWHKCIRGGDGRKYVGNELIVMDWSASARLFYERNGGMARQDVQRQEGITWSKIATSRLSFRVKPSEYFNSASSPAICGKAEDVGMGLALLNSKVAQHVLGILNPTAGLQVSDILKLPCININVDAKNNCNRCVEIARHDWDAYETSWDFAVNPLVGLCDSLRPLRSLRQQPQAIPHSSFPIPNSLNPVNPVNPVENNSGAAGVRALPCCADGDGTPSLPSRNVSGASDKSEFRMDGLCDSLRPLRSMRQQPQAIPHSSFPIPNSLNPVNPVNPVENNSGVRGTPALPCCADGDGTPSLPSRNVSGASDKSEFRIAALYTELREKWARDCEEMRRLETENNRIFIEAYGLQDELTPEVPWHEITLTCNPFYRYGAKSAECGVRSDGTLNPVNPVNPVEKETEGLRQLTKSLQSDAENLASSGKLSTRIKTRRPRIAV